MALQWPLVVARLVELLPTLPGWGQVTVYDGAAFDTQALTFATVGHADDGVTTTAGHCSSTQSPDGFQYEETGTVACTLNTSDDKAPVPVLRNRLFTLLNQLDAAVRADRRLGVLSQEGTAEVSFDVSQSQIIPGNSLTVVFTVSYFTVT